MISEKLIMRDEISSQFIELKFQPGHLPSFFFKEKSYVKNVDNGNLINTVQILMEKLNIV